MSTRYLRGPGDTNILIHLERLAADHLPSELATSTVSLAELSAGVHSAVDAVERARRVLRVQRVEATFSPLPFDVEAARQYGIIAAKVISIGRKPRGRVADLMIASIAAANRLPPVHHQPRRLSRTRVRRNRCPGPGPGLTAGFLSLALVDAPEPPLCAGYCLMPMEKTFVQIWTICAAQRALLLANVSCRTLS